MSVDQCMDLSTITSVVCSIQRVVADFYGPQCTQTLLTSQTGKAVVTSDGFSIIEALHPSHPIAQLVFRALKSCHSHTLDGSKLFLLYLANYLVHLQQQIALGKFYHGGTNLKSNRKVLEKQGTICARRYIRIMIDEVLPLVCRKLHVHSETLAKTLFQKMNRGDVQKCVLTTVLVPHYNPRLCRHFADLLMSCLLEVGRSESSADTLKFVVDRFFSLTVKVSSRPYGESTVLDPVLLNRAFTLKCENIPSLGNVLAVILRARLDGANPDEEAQETISITQTGQMVNFVQNRRKVVENFAQKCAVKQIRLVICTEGAPGYAVDIFRHFNISVIANAAEVDVELLEFLTGKLSVHNVNDCLEDSNVICLAGVNELTIGGQQFTQLKLIDGSYAFKHLVVCAPTVGLCDQLAISLQKGLNALRMCFLHETTMKYLYQDGEADVSSINLESDVSRINLESDVSSINLEKTEHSLLPSAQENCAQYKDHISEARNDIPGIDLEKTEHIIWPSASEKFKHQNDKSDATSNIQQIDLEKSEHLPLPFATENLQEDTKDQHPADDSGDMVDETSCETLQDSKHHQGETLSIIEGGGSFEILLAKLLRDFTAKCRDPNLSLMCKILDDTLVSVVKKLYENTKMETGSKRGFIELNTILAEQACSGRVWGIDRRGVPCSLADKRVMEPLMSKLHVVHCTLRLFDQLLGMDTIVSVRKLENEDVKVQ